MSSAHLLYEILPPPPPEWICCFTPYTHLFLDIGLIFDTPADTQVNSTLLKEDFNPLHV